MNSHPFDMIPVVDPNDSRKVIGIVTSEAILNLLTETKKTVILPYFVGRMYLIWTSFFTIC
jgi:CBS domain-containing protein